MLEEPFLKMDSSTHLNNRNKLHSLLILGSMAVLLTIIGYIFAGFSGALFAVFLATFSYMVTPRISPNLMLNIYRAEPLPRSSAPGLYAALEMIVEKAHLHNVPELYYLPSPIINSFTLGDEGNSKIVLSDGLLRSLDAGEIVAVLAHECGHIVNKDLKVMALADVMSRITRMMAISGLILLFLYLPLLAINKINLPIFGIFLLTFAPNITALLQMALSRTREYSADQRAVELTGDAIALIGALTKIDVEEKFWAKRLLIPHYRLSEPSLLRTHPSKNERVARLQVLAKEQSQKQQFLHNSDIQLHNPGYENKKPRHRFHHGVWY